MIGIYSITNIVNNKRYVGSSNFIERRFKQHQSDLKNSKHINPVLQKAWIKYGAKNFKYEVLEVCPSQTLLEREEFWINHLGSHFSKNGYNICLYPRAGRLGIKVTPETLLKMKKANGGKNHPNWGKKLSKEHVKNMIKAVTGIKKPSSGLKKKYYLINPDGVQVEILGIRKFARENNLNATSILKVATGKQESHRGWKSVFPVKKALLYREKSPVIAVCNDKEYVFLSMSDAQRSNLFDKPVSASNISNVCRGKVKFCGKINGKPVFWKYNFNGRVA